MCNKAENYYYIFVKKYYSVNWLQNIINECIIMNCNNINELYIRTNELWFAGSNKRCLVVLQADGSEIYLCKRCSRSYKSKKALYDHQRYECGKEPRFQCSFCPYKAKLKGNFRRHLAVKHFSQVDLPRWPLGASVNSYWWFLVI